MSWDIEVREKVYQRLANEIFFRILHGEYGLGTKMPSYTELSKTAGSSPETVRKAFSELCRLGLIDKTRYGYFVTSNHGRVSLRIVRIILQIWKRNIWSQKQKFV